MSLCGYLSGSLNGSTSVGVFSASLFSLIGRCDNPVPSRFLPPIDCSKIPALFAICLYHYRFMTDFGGGGGGVR
jgi:hypothetical protein